MPHFVIEHAGCLSATAEAQTVMELVLECGASCGFINREDIKVRLTPSEHILFGDGRSSFIHVTVSLLAGRTDKQKESLAISMRASLVDRFSAVQSISIDIRDMNPLSYKKRLC